MTNLAPTSQQPISSLLGRNQVLAPDGTMSWQYKQYFAQFDQVARFVAAPATATTVGVEGQLATDGSFLYVCIARNSWKRVALSSF